MSSSEIQKLSAAEREFLPCLEAVEPNSIWGAAIHTVLADLDVLRFRRLVSDLKSQADDSEPVMVNILGELCYSKLKSL